MPPEVRQEMNDIAREVGLEGEVDEVRTIAVEAVPISMEGELLQIGDVSYETFEPSAPELVPEIVFFDVPSHTLILRSMLKDYGLGEHILLMGNQGVGKNKLTDRMLMLMKRERQYIQLPRDTTVPTLTLNPSLRDGRIIWED